MSMNRAIALDRLGAIVEQGKASAATTVQHVMAAVPADYIARSSALRFETGDERGLTVGIPNGESFRVHNHALGQVSQHLSIPGAYVRELVDGAPWQRALARTVLTEHASHDERRNLLRVVTPADGRRELRGFLSDRYRRLDSRPLLDAFFQAVQRVGALPSWGSVTDTRVSVRVILPEVMEPTPGELIVAGIDWHNSDFGAGRFSLSAFNLRLVCNNGMVGADALKQIHLGRQLGESIEWSRETLQRDTRTMVSATHDVVKQLLSPESRERTAEQVRKANEAGLSTGELSRRLRTLSKDESRRVLEAFEGPDVVNLPPTQTAWRASQALAWVAQTLDGDRRVELERLAGAITEAPRAAA